MQKSYKIKMGREGIEFRTTFADRVVNFFSPELGQKRLQSRATMALAGSYIGASTSRRATSQWNPWSRDADGDTITDLPTLRARSRDMVRNAPLALGAVNTACTNAVGTGLRLQARIDREVLGMDEPEADAWEAQVTREWALFADSQECDAARSQNFYDIQDLVFRSTLESGDTFVLMPYIERPGSPYGLKLQVIEADRVCNEGSKANTDTLVSGVEKDKYGAPVSYHIMDQHPGSFLNAAKRTWTKVPAFGKQTGRRNVIHLFQMLRPGQTRGVPFLAPVIEPLKQLDRYSEAELMATVISGMFTVFIETPTGEGFAPMGPTSETGGKTSDEDMKLSPGAIVALAKGEKISPANPGRPNTAFDPFVMAILRQIGAALEIPFELLIKHFTSSYSAARAALLEAWKFFSTQRKWLAENFCQVVYEAWMTEAVATGRISAPGFFDDPVIRKAYLGAEWIGPAKGMIDERSEIEAAQMRVDMGVSTLQEETAALTGGSWEQKHPQSAKEHRMRKEAGLIPDSAPGQQAQQDEQITEQTRFEKLLNE